MPMETKPNYRYDSAWVICIIWGAAGTLSSIFCSVWASSTFPLSSPSAASSSRSRCADWASPIIGAAARHKWWKDPKCAPGGGEEETTRCPSARGRSALKHKLEGELVFYNQTPPCRITWTLWAWAEPATAQPGPARPGPARLRCITLRMKEEVGGKNTSCLPSPVFS